MSKHISTFSISNTQAILFCVFCGIITTLWKYEYGGGDQVEQIPIILRAMDTNYLTKDFFTNAGSAFGPRYYYAHFVAWWSRIFSLTSVLFLFTLLYHISISLLSYKVARNLFRKSDLAGIWAAILVMTIRTVDTGSVSEFYISGITPYAFTFPFIILAFYASLKNKPVIVALYAGIASLFHPLAGLGYGFIFLFSGFITEVSTRKITVKNFRIFFTAGLVLISFGVATIIPYLLTFEKSIPDNEFIGIIARFRHPHHYIPTYILSPPAILKSIFFLLAATLAFFAWKKKFFHPVYYRNIVINSFSIAALCLGGYFFTEVYPLRMFVTLQPFRFLDILKWLGLLLMAGTITQALHSKKQFIVLLTGILSPVTAGITFSHGFISERFKNKGITKLNNPLLILPVIVIYLIYRGYYSNIYLYVLFSLLLLLLYYKPKGFYAAILILGLIIATNHTKGLSPLLHRTIPFFTKHFHLQAASPSLTEKEKEMVEKIKTLTPTNAILLVPPDMGHLRYTAQRAIVVDFKAFPFPDMAMREWQKRVFDCYGKPESSGFEAASEMKENYHKITREQRKILHEKYGCDYAVLYHKDKLSLEKIEK